MNQTPLTNKQLNRVLSKRAGKTIRAVPNACWQNAYRSLLELPELANGHYVEGWIVRTDLPVPLEHAWLELDGQIIDPTPISWSSPFVYFPGLRLTKSEVLQVVTDETPLPIVWQHGWGGMKHQLYVQAYQQAWAYGLPEVKVQRLLKPARRVLP